jgi:putative SOS response-associated peptidase YedK
MAPKYHPTPLSGGDRKALNKELGKARAMANILAAQSAEMRAKGEAIIQQADKLLCESWNERMWSDGEPIDPSPTIDQAVNGGFPWLEIRCARCKTPSDVDGGDEASAHHLRARPSQPAALPKMRQGRPTPRGDPATTGLAAAPSSNRPLTMCNLYSITTNQAAIIALFRVINRYVGNLAPMPGVFLDYQAPIVRSSAEGRELVTARWGMPSSSKALMDATKKRAEKLQAKGTPVDFKELLRMEPDGGTTNIRNVTSKHWTRWLAVENRCVVPFNSFSEFNKAEGGDIWFALDDTRPLACFAGIWTNWTSVRKVKEGETTNDVYAFLTTEPNAEVGAIHPKAMPVVLTTPEEVETWMTAAPGEALKLQRPLPDGALRIVARGVKEDPAEIA